jgi:hypothetical protein
MKTEALSADQRATAVIGKNDPITAMAVPSDDGDGAAINVHHASPAQPHVTCLFFSKPRGAAAAAVTARFVPAAVMTITTPVATTLAPPIAAVMTAIIPTLLHEDTKFGTRSSSRRRRCGKAGKRNKSGDPGSYEDVGH